MKRCVRLVSLQLAAALDFCHIAFGFSIFNTLKRKAKQKKSPNPKPLGFLTRRYEVNSLKCTLELWCLYPLLIQALRLNTKWYSKNKSMV